MFTRKLFTVLLLAGLLLSSLVPVAGSSSSGTPVQFIPLMINPRAEGIQQDAVLWLPLAIPKTWGGCYNFRIVTQGGQEVPYYAFRCFDGDQGAMIPPYMSLAEYRIVRNLSRSFQLCTINNRQYLNVRPEMLASYRTYYVGSILHYLILPAESYPTTLIRGFASAHSYPPHHGWWAYQINMTSYFLVPFVALVSSATLHLDFYHFRPLFIHNQRVEGAAINCQANSILFTANNITRYWGRFNGRTQIPLESVVTPSTLLSKSFSVQLVPGINVLNLNFTASYVNAYLRLTVPGHHVVLILLRIPQTVAANDQLMLYIMQGSTNPFNRGTFSVFVEDFEQRTLNGLRILLDPPMYESFLVYDGRVWYSFTTFEQYSTPPPISLEIASMPVRWGLAMWTLIKYIDWRDIHVMNSIATTAFRDQVESVGSYGPRPSLPFDMLQWAVSWQDRNRWVGAFWFWNTPHHYHAVSYNSSVLPTPDRNYYWNTWHGISLRTDWDPVRFQPIDFIGVSVSPPQNPLGWNVIAFPSQTTRVQVSPSSSSGSGLYAEINMQQVLWGGDSISRGVKLRSGLIDFLNVSPGSRYVLDPPRSMLTLQLVRPPSNTTLLFVVGNDMTSLTVSNIIRWQEGSNVIEITPTGSISAVYITIAGTTRRLTVLYASGKMEFREAQTRAITIESIYFITPSRMIVALMEHQYFQIYQPGLLHIHISYVDYLGRRGSVMVSDAVNVLMPNNVDIDLQEDHVTVALAFVYPLRANITMYVEPQEVPFLILIPQIEATPAPLTIRATGERFIFSSLNQSLSRLPVPDYIKPIIAVGVILGSLLTVPVLPATVSASLAIIFAMFFIWTRWIPLPPTVSTFAVLSLLAALLILALISHRLRGKT